MNDENCLKAIVKILLNVVLWVLIVWIFTRLHLPGNSLFHNALQNSGHGVVFFVLTIFAMMTLGASSRCVFVSSAAVPAVMFTIGISIETLQQSSGRGGSTSDLIMNGAGIASAFIIFRVIHKKPHSALSICWIVFAILLLVWCIHKPFMFLITEHYEKPLPILNDFDSTGAGYKVHVSDAHMEIADYSSAWLSNDTKSLKVDFQPGNWPSITFQETHSRWCEYDFLKFEVLNLENGDIRLNIRVDDASINYPDHSFMTVSRMLMNGAGEVVIPLAELAHYALKRGEPTFNEVTSLMLYLPNNHETKTLYFDNFHLAKNMTDRKSECS